MGEVREIARNRAWITLEFPNGRQVKICGRKNAQIFIDEYNNKEENNKEENNNDTSTLHTKSENTVPVQRNELQQDSLRVLPGLRENSNSVREATPKTNFISEEQRERCGDRQQRSGKANRLLTDVGERAGAVTATGTELAAAATAATAAATEIIAAATESNRRIGEYAIAITELAIVQNERIRDLQSSERHLEPHTIDVTTS